MGAQEIRLRYLEKPSLTRWISEALIAIIASPLETQDAESSTAFHGNHFKHQLCSINDVI